MFWGSKKNADLGRWAEKKVGYFGYFQLNFQHILCYCVSLIHGFPLINHCSYKKAFGHYKGIHTFGIGM